MFGGFGKRTGGRRVEWDAPSLLDSTTIFQLRRSGSDGA